MKKETLKKLKPGIIFGISLIVIIMIISVIVGVEKRLGATIPVVPALFKTTLATKISKTATSMTLTTGTDKSGDALAGYICFAIDEGMSSEEFVCGTTAGTAVSSMIRGIDPIDGDTEVTALKKAHRRGAIVKVTNYPQIGILSRILNGDETVPNIMTYASANTFTAGSNQLAAVKYVDDVSIAGAADATFITKGIVEIATLSETILGTATGSTGASLVPFNMWFDDDFSATTTIPVTGTDGKLDQGFIDLSEVFTFTGGILATTSPSYLGIVNASGAFTASSTGSFGGNVDMNSNKLTELAVGSSATDSVRYDQVVLDTGNQTIAGTKTFSTIPELPASNPTTANQAVRKAYSDLKELLSNKSTSTSLGTSDTLYPTQNAVKTYADTRIKEFGAREARAMNTEYDENIDGFVVGWVEPTCASWELKADTSSPPTTVRYKISVDASTPNAGFMVPVLDDEYWIADACGGTIWWIPLDK